jgi:hypothetical protein
MARCTTTNQNNFVVSKLEDDLEIDNKKIFIDLYFDHVD